MGSGRTLSARCDVASAHPIHQRSEQYRFLQCTHYSTRRYDAANTRSRTDRNDGSHDRYCAPEKPFQSTACTHLVLGKDRWLVFPQENDCCWCCDASHGCGILTPDWLQRSNASYVGHLDSYRGYPAEEWNAQGL